MTLAAASPQHTHRKLFDPLPATYFSPSCPKELIAKYALFGGSLLPRQIFELCGRNLPHDFDGFVPSADPLELDVQLFFVTQGDPLIPHLIARPVVLYDFEWVRHCIKVKELRPRGRWVIMPAVQQNQAASPASDNEQISCFLDQSRLVPGSITPTSPGPVEKVGRAPRPPIQLKATIDFNANTCLDHSTGMTTRLDQAILGVVPTATSAVPEGSSERQASDSRKRKIPQATDAGRLSASTQQAKRSRHSASSRGTHTSVRYDLHEVLGLLRARQRS